MARLDKQASGRRWIDLQTQVNGWDPMGLISYGAPIDEYSCLVGLLMRLLEKGEAPITIAAALDHEMVDHFGDSPRDRGSQKFAEQVSRWFNEHWHGSSV